MATGDAPEQATETVYAAVDWTDHRTGTEVKQGDTVSDVPVAVADWLVRAGVVTRDKVQYEEKPSSEELKAQEAQQAEQVQQQAEEPSPSKDGTGHRRARKD